MSVTHTRGIERHLASARGAVLIQVAVAVLVLSAFGMFVIDYGVLWVSRNQAQNAADSGALAGAIALVFDGSTDRSATGPIKTSARNFAQANLVWGQAPDVQAATDVRFYPDAPTAFPASCSADDCVRVDVYRNQARNNPLPMFVGGLVGVTSQGVRATAIAQAAAANATNCLKPWAVLDKWAENPGPWTETSSFDPATDSYVAPTASSPGTSYTLAADLGVKVKLKLGDPSNSKEVFGAGWYSPLQLGCTGGDCYRDNISGCATGTYAVGGTLGVENGNMKGPTKQGVDALYDLDPTARWDAAQKRVVGSAHPVSPRIVALPIVNTQEAWDSVHTGDKSHGAGNMTVKIVGILGFFVEGMDGDDVVGYLATKPDLLLSNGGGVNPQSAFIKAVRLVR